MTTQRNYASASIAVIAAAHGGIALATFFAVRAFGHTLSDLAIDGSGIGAVSRGVWHASRLPLSAAWIAAIASLAALLFVAPAALRELRGASDAGRSASLLWIAVPALLGGAVSIFMFQQAIEFMLDVITPGGTRVPSIPTAIAGKLLLAALMSALWVVVALCIAAVALRRRAPSRIAFRTAAVALVASVAVSAMMIVELRDYSGRFRDIALYGRFR